jgi:hypothetical protein
MKRFLKSWTLATILMAALASVVAPRAAAQSGSISGTILDVSGKPWGDVVIRSVSEQGAKQETKTDSAGKFSLPNLRSGTYTVLTRRYKRGLSYRRRPRTSAMRLRRS